MVMLPSRLRWWWFALLTVVSTKAHDGSSDLPRGLLETWRRGAKDEVRLFDRLPRYVERSYTPPQIIEHRGYPVEIHHVTTDDGYILELHRIPSNTSGKVVFLQHGVLQSSGTWLIDQSSRSLGYQELTSPIIWVKFGLLDCQVATFLLADLSYDVWLGNVRGNRFSRKHTTLSPDKDEYWKFSWDEIGNYDIPSVVNYILKETDQPKLSYIGHSLGCGVFFIAMVKHPELNAKIEIMIALAPLSSFAYITNDVFRVLAPHAHRVEVALKLAGVHSGLDSEGFGDRFLNVVCEQFYIQAHYCRNWFRFVVGPSENLDPAMIPLFNVNFLRGTSVGVLAQFAQNYNAGNVFQAYDFGQKDNLLVYGSTKPFEYDLTKITAPVYVFSGGKDELVTTRDVDWLLSKLRNLSGSTRISDYSHLDFIWGIDAKERLYEEVFALLPPP